jgi:hypothetical protein
MTRVNSKDKEDIKTHLGGGRGSRLLLGALNH